MKRAFVDSSGFFALICEQDRHHDRARLLFEQANQARWRLVTTNAVVTESHALLLTRLRDGRRHALEFLDRLTESEIEIDRVRAADERRALSLLHAHADKDFSLCDALSFVVMERLGITEAIAFDRHFRQYGRLTVL